MSIVYMMRRLLFVFTTNYLTKSPMMQVNLIFIGSLMTLSFLMRTQPYESKLMNLMEIFNEFTFLSVTYFTLLLTGYMDSDPEFQY